MKWAYNTGHICGEGNKLLPFPSIASMGAFNTMVTLQDLAKNLNCIVNIML